MRRVVLIVLAVAIGASAVGCAGELSSSDSDTYCQENPYAKSCGNDPNPDEDFADPCDHVLERNCDPGTKEGDTVPDRDGEGLGAPDALPADSAPEDDPSTLPDESNGPTECDVEYDPDYCGDYHGP